MNVLILISGHLLSCPRAVKFADALSRAGHTVHVIGVAALPELMRDDAALAATRSWSYQGVQPATGVGARLVQWLARTLSRSGWRSRAVLGASEYCMARPIVKALPKRAVDLLILSNLPAFAAALHVLPNRLSALTVHVDLEDDHVAMLPDLADQQPERARRHALIANTLQHADLCTAASPLMCTDLSERYGKPVQCVLNVFDPVPAPRHSPDSALIWQSQTIGPERGLEAFVRVLARVPNPPRLVLRGMLMPGFDLLLRATAESAGLPASHLQFAPLCPPQHLLAQTTGFRAGLAIEVAPERNRQHCLTNKLFEYLAAGVPVILSRTPAHEAILLELGDAAVLIDLDDPSGAGQTLRRWLAESAAQQAASAHQLARDRFNWTQHSTDYLALLPGANQPH